jgi:hypothetical protein
MDDHAVRWANFSGLHPQVPSEAGGNDDVLVVDDPGGGDIVGDGELIDFVGLANLPACDPIHRRRKILGVTFGSAGVCPFGERFFFGGREAHCIGKVAVARIGEPRRHFARLDSDFHRLSPRTHLSVVQHGEWARFAGTMADLAVFLDYGRHVF